MEPTLFLLLLVCHYICDYSHLSTDTMLSAKRVGYPLYPIFLHAFIHAAFMLVVLSFFHLGNIVLLSLFLLQLCTHFTIDVLKGRMNVWYPVVSSPVNRSHWYIFGLDQLLHHVVIVLMCVIAK